jgi:hypothetical protein
LNLILDSTFSDEENDFTSSDGDNDFTLSDGVNDFTLSNGDNNNLPNLHYDNLSNLHYDDYIPISQDANVIIDPDADFCEGESTINLEIAKYICKANLDKAKTSELLSLLKHVHNHNEGPPSSNTELWRKLNVQFDYVRLEYCTNCMMELINGSVCLCNKNHGQPPTELIVFSIVNEITRVVKNNYHLILKYRSEKNNVQDDIIQGMFHLHRVGEGRY